MPNSHYTDSNVPVTNWSNIHHCLPSRNVVWYGV